MCEPASLSMAATIASTIVGVQGARQQAQATRDSANYQAQVSENNRMLAERYAQMEIEKGRNDEQNMRMSLHQAQGAQRAALAASGVALDTGSALSVQSDLARAGETDALTIRSNAAKAAYQHRVTAGSEAANADLYRMEASNATKSGRYAVASSIIGGASSVADKWTKFKQVGAWS